jgi:hypothetical protein
LGEEGKQLTAALNKLLVVSGEDLGQTMRIFLCSEGKMLALFEGVPKDESQGREDGHEDEKKQAGMKAG